MKWLAREWRVLVFLATLIALTVAVCFCVGCATTPAQLNTTMDKLYEDTKDVDQEAKRGLSLAEALLAQLPPNLIAQGKELVAVLKSLKGKTGKLVPAVAKARKQAKAVGEDAADNSWSWGIWLAKAWPGLLLITVAIVLLVYPVGGLLALLKPILLTFCLVGSVINALMLILAAIPTWVWVLGAVLVVLAGAAKLWTLLKKTTTAIADQPNAETIAADVKAKGTPGLGWLAARWNALVKPTVVNPTTPVVNPTTEPKP
jgi:hypothetical protein